VGFLESEAKVNASSQGLFAIKRYSSHSNYSQEVSRRITGLHLAAYFGAETVVKLLDPGKVDADSEDEDGRTPLSFAAQNGHEAVVKLLLEKGTKVDSKDKRGRTPLSWAAWNGREEDLQVKLRD
jgi:ankyrin repeat protein